MGGRRLPAIAMMIGPSDFSLLTTGVLIAGVILLTLDIDRLQEGVDQQPMQDVSVALIATPDKANRTLAPSAPAVRAGFLHRLLLP